MNFIQEIKNICDDYKNSKIGMFIDMDGVITDFDIYGYQNIRNNIPKTFLNKRPLNSTINVLKQLAEIENLNFYIVSACHFKNQAEEKSLWLDKHAPFIKKDNRYFVIKEIEKYTIKTKPAIKVRFIKEIMKKDKLDLSIYIEDEHEMLRQANEELKNKVIRYHVSSLIE